jgi:hypothetical protein
MNVTDVAILELERQGIVEAVSALGFNPPERKAVVGWMKGNSVSWPLVILQ